MINRWIAEQLFIICTIFKNMFVSQCNGFLRHVSVSSVQNMSAERVLLSPARYRTRVSQAILFGARVRFISVGAFALEICWKVIRVHPSRSISHARYGRAGKPNEEEAQNGLGFFYKRVKRCSIVLFLIARLDCTINASDRADKSAIVAIVIPSLCIHSVLLAVFRSLPFGAWKRDEFQETWSKATTSIHWHGDRIEIYAWDNAIVNCKMIMW